MKTATAEDFVTKCLQEEGDEYEMGAEADPGVPCTQTEEWDCSGLVWTKLQELGIEDVPRSSTAQLNWCIEKKTTMPLEEGVRTRGALLLREGHVAVSLGNGKTIEAMGEKYGVLIASATEGRTFTHAARVPGLSYTGGALQQPSASAGSGFQPLRNGDKGGAVETLQRRLSTVGFSPGPIDGDFGPKTEAAVKQFQRANKLPETGIVDSQSWARLRASARLPTAIAGSSGTWQSGQTYGRRA
jgi:cell wall-associated NlpC family hydrolase